MSILLPRLCTRFRYTDRSAPPLQDRLSANGMDIQPNNQMQKRNAMRKTQINNTKRTQQQRPLRGRRRRMSGWESDVRFCCAGKHRPPRWFSCDSRPALLDPHQLNTAATPTTASPESLTSNLITLIKYSSLPVIVLSAFYIWMERGNEANLLTKEASSELQLKPQQGIVARPVVRVIFVFVFALGVFVRSSALCFCLSPRANQHTNTLGCEKVFFYSGGRGRGVQGRVSQRRIVRRHTSAGA